MRTKADIKEAVRKRTLIDALYREHHGALRMFLARRFLDRDAVADIVQETYCRVQQADKVDEIRNPKAFLIRVAKNVWLNQRKLRRNEMERVTTDLESLQIASDEPEPYRSVMGEQELALVQVALEELSPTCRAAFVMNRFENKTYPQIAIELELSVSMIEKHISYAISHMRERLEDSRGSRVGDSPPAGRRDVAPK